MDLHVRCLHRGTALLVAVVELIEICVCSRGNPFGEDGDVPTPADERMHMNLWLTDSDGDQIGDPPTCAAGGCGTMQVDIVGFEYIAGNC